MFFSIQMRKIYAPVNRMESTDTDAGRTPGAPVEWRRLSTATPDTWSITPPDTVDRTCASLLCRPIVVNNDSIIANTVKW